MKLFVNRAFKRVALLNFKNLTGLICICSTWNIYSVKIIPNDIQRHVSKPTHFLCGNCASIRPIAVLLFFSFFIHFEDAKLLLFIRKAITIHFFGRDCEEDYIFSDEIAWVIANCTSGETVEHLISQVAYCISDQIKPSYTSV